MPAYPYDYHNPNFHASFDHSLSEEYPSTSSDISQSGSTSIQFNQYSTFPRNLPPIKSSKSTSSSRNVSSSKTLPIRNALPTRPVSMPQYNFFLEEQGKNFLDSHEPKRNIPVSAKGYESRLEKLERQIEPIEEEPKMVRV